MRNLRSGRTPAVLAGIGTLLALSGLGACTTTKRSGTPTPVPTATAVPTSTIVPTSTATATRTNTYTPTYTLGAPTVVVVASPTVGIRIWETVHFDARQTTGGAPMTFAWNFGDGSAIAYGSVIAHHYVQPGSYTATLAVTNSFGAGSANVAVTVVAEPYPNMTFLGQVTLPVYSGGLWAKPPMAYVPQWDWGGSVGAYRLVNYSTPTSPVVVGSMTSGVLRPREARAFGPYLVGASEPQFGGSSWSIINVETPTAPTVVGLFGAGLSASHTVGYWDNMVIVNTGRSWTPQVAFYDVRNPAAPTQVGSWSGSPNGIHDTQRVGNLLYVAAPYHGFYVLDISNPSAPTTVVDHTYAGGYTHNVWPSKTGQFVLTVEEDPSEPLRIWDISNPSSVTLVSTWIPPTGSAIIHNVVVVGDYAYVACYTYGLVVLDISNPASPTMIYHYDTYPADDSANYNGAWMVYPFGDKVLVSDMDAGFFVFGK